MFLPQYQRNSVFSERKLKKALRDTLTRTARYGLDNGKLAAIVVKKKYLIISVAQFLHDKDGENYSNYPLRFLKPTVQSGLWIFQ